MVYGIPTPLKALSIFLYHDTKSYPVDRYLTVKAKYHLFHFQSGHPEKAVMKSITQHSED